MYLICFDGSYAYSDDCPQDFLTDWAKRNYEVIDMASTPPKMYLHGAWEELPKALRQFGEPG